MGSLGCACLSYKSNLSQFSIRKIIQAQSSRLSPVQAQSNLQQLTLPQNYDEATRQAQLCVQSALDDGKYLLEIEFPVIGLCSVFGDGEGANEMTLSMQYLRTFVSLWERSKQEETVRIFFPDQKELQVAKKGSKKFDGVFNDTKFKLDYLTKPSPFLDIGLDVTKFKASTKVAPSDKILVIAYPSFNVNEMLSVWEMHGDLQAQQNDRETSIVIFNGELDRVRSGYYPPLFYPKVGKMAKEFIPQFTQAYYIHNFKGSKPGTLFRAYPGPWQVYRRNMFDMEEVQLVHTQDDMPSLQEVALNILPNT